MPLWRQPLFWVTLFCAAVVRFVGLFTHATMADEAFTFFIASHNVSGIIHLLRVGDFHPPLVYLIGHVLMQFTPQAILFRSVTALFGVAGVAASYALARRIIGAWGPAAAMLVAVNPALAFFDGYFRMYPLLWSLAILSWACLLWSSDEPRSWIRWLIYGIVTIGLLYTQYLAFFTVVAQIGYMAFSRRAVLGYWLACAGAITAFAPWVPILAAQYPLGGTAYNGSLSGHLGLAVAKLPALLLFDGTPASVADATATTIAIDMVVIGGIIAAVALHRGVAIALFVPLVLQLAYSIASGKLLLGERYLLQAVVPIVFFCVLFCVGLSQVRLRLPAIAVASIIAVLEIGGTADKHFLAPYQPINWTVYRKFLEEKMKPGDAIVFDDSMTYYILVGSPVTQKRAMFSVSNQQDAQKVARQVATVPRVWYVGYQTELPDPNELVFKSLLRTHPHHVSWRTTDAAYGDVVLTALFVTTPDARVP